VKRVNPRNPGLRSGLHDLEIPRRMAHVRGSTTPLSTPLGRPLTTRRPNPDSRATGCWSSSRRRAMGAVYLGRTRSGAGAAMLRSRSCARGPAADERSLRLSSGEADTAWRDFAIPTSPRFTRSAGPRAGQHYLTMELVRGAHPRRLAHGAGSPWSPPSGGRSSPVAWRCFGTSAMRCTRSPARR